MLAIDRTTLEPEKLSAQTGGTPSTRKNKGKYVPRVSIGLPVYNGEGFLEEAMDAIVMQSYNDFEIIISDNASTDRTREICEDYASRDPRIRYFRSEVNKGAAWNYNRVFELARGEYFRWAAHDDLIEPEYLATCVEVLDRNPSVVLCYPKTMIIDGKGRPMQLYPDNLHLRAQEPNERYEGYFKRYYPHRDECNAIFGLIRTKVLAQTALIGNYPASDMILLGELALLGEVFQTPEVLFLRRDHEKTSVRANREIEKRAIWFDPKNEGKIFLPRWRWFGEYLDGIRRARISFKEKLVCTGVAMKGFLPSCYKIMLRELGGAAVKIVMRPFFRFRKNNLASEKQSLLKHRRNEPEAQEMKV